MTERERHQLGIGIGEGPEGARIREVLDRAAARVGKLTSVWARDVLLVAAADPKSEGPVEPIIEVRLNGRTTLLDLRAISSMKLDDRTRKAKAFVGGKWVVLGTAQPGHLLEHWKRVRCSGLAY